MKRGEEGRKEGKEKEREHGQDNLKNIREVLGILRRFLFEFDACGRN